MLAGHLSSAWSQVDNLFRRPAGPIIGCEIGHFSGGGLCSPVCMGVRWCSRVPSGPETVVALRLQRGCVWNDMGVIRTV